MKRLCKESLEKTIDNLEILIQEHEETYKKHPMFLGVDKEAYSHKERAEDYKQLLKYLEELKDFRQRESA